MPKLPAYAPATRTHLHLATPILYFLTITGIILLQQCVRLYALSFACIGLNCILYNPNPPCTTPYANLYKLSFFLSFSRWKLLYFSIFILTHINFPHISYYTSSFDIPQAFVCVNYFHHHFTFSHISHPENLSKRKIWFSFSFLSRCSVCERMKTPRKNISIYSQFLRPSVWYGNIGENLRKILMKN